MSHLPSYYVEMVLSLVVICLTGAETMQFTINPGAPIRVVIPGNETCLIYAQNIQTDVRFLLIQLHTQRFNLSLSTEATFKKENTKTGTSVGIISPRRNNLVSWYLQSEAANNVTAVVSLQTYTQFDPLPGGCNQVFNLELDPSVVLTVKTHSTHIWFQWANLITPQTQAQLDCENVTVMNHLSYDVYVSYVPQRDFSLDTFLSSIESMLSPSSIVSHGLKVFSVKDGPSSKSEVIVTSQKGQGAMYAVVVTRSDTQRQAAYVIAATYACDFQSSECSSGISVLEVTFCIALCIAGLFLMCVGHIFFKTALFLFGLTFVSLLTYILLTVGGSSDLTMKLPVSMVLGVVGGLAWTAYWYYFAFPVITVMVPGLCAGYLVASTLFFTPFGNIWWWDTAVNYGIAFTCTVLIFVVMLMAFQKVLSIASSGIVGAFMFLMCLAIPLRLSLELIFFNSLYHQTETGYVKVKVAFPFHLQDIVLISLWPILAAAGILFQCYKTRHRPHFDSPVHSSRRLAADTEVSQSLVESEEDHDERRPLLTREDERALRLAREDERALRLAREDEKAPRLAREDARVSQLTRRSQGPVTLYQAIDANVK